MIFKELELLIDFIIQSIISSFLILFLFLNCKNKREKSQGKFLIQKFDSSIVRSLLLIYHLVKKNR